MTSEIRRVGDAGVHTVEGNLAGSRAARLSRQREEQRLDYEASRARIRQDNAVGVVAGLSTAGDGGGSSGSLGIDGKFSSGADHVDDDFRRRTVGLVSAADFRRARIEADSALPSFSSSELPPPSGQQAAEQARQRTAAAAKRKKAGGSLSFADEDVDGDDNQDAETGVATGMGGGSGKRGRAKDPSVDTSFLPDKARDEQLRAERRRLEDEWRRAQELVKAEELRVAYSYWDGAGHRSAVTVKKGTTIGAFLAQCRQQLLPTVPELRVVSPESLMYVKEDVIIPHHFTFYDLLVASSSVAKSTATTSASNKLMREGLVPVPVPVPLFRFDVQQDLRLVVDARVGSEESHAGKVVERRWYERNKHIFPASRWQTFDPAAYIQS